MGFWFKRQALDKDRTSESMHGPEAETSGHGTETSAGSARAILAAVGALFISLAIIAPVNHDESQYFAAAELTWEMRPFADFLYHQTPLQPYVTAPIAALSDRWSFLTLRLFTGLMAIGVLLLVYHSQRTLSVGRATALAATLLLALCFPFQFGATVVRNDMLPAFLSALGSFLALRSIAGAARGDSYFWIAIGFVLAAAAGAKITYAFHAAAAALFLLIEIARGDRRAAIRRLALFALGAAPVIVAILLVRARAPEAFDYGVYEFNARTALHWYQVQEYRGLDLVSKIGDVAYYLAQGAGLLALVWVAAAFLRRRREKSAPGARLFLDLMVIGGLAAALLPTPSWTQYLIPLLVPLFVRLGVAVAAGVRPSGRLSIVAAAALVAAVLTGISEPAKWIIRAAREPEHAVTMTRDAHWIGERLRAANAQGAIATLTPEATLDSGYRLDPRFAPGPFFYRTGDLISPARQRRLHAISPATVDLFLSESPPAAIVTGYESRKIRYRHLEDALSQFARDHGYVLHRSPTGPIQLYIAPGSSSVAPASAERN